MDKTNREDPEKPCESSDRSEYYPERSWQAPKLTTLKIESETMGFTPPGS